MGLFNPCPNCDGLNLGWLVIYSFSGKPFLWGTLLWQKYINLWVPPWGVTTLSHQHFCIWKQSSHMPLDSRMNTWVLLSHSQEDLNLRAWDTSQDLLTTVPQRLAERLTSPCLASWDISSIHYLTHKREKVCLLFAPRASPRSITLT